MNRKPTPMSTRAAMASLVGGDESEFGKPLPPVLCIYCSFPVQLSPFVSWLVKTINRRLNARDERELGPRDVAVCDRNGGACMKLWQADRSAQAAKVVREMREREDAERRRSGDDEQP